jgi:uncharacterized protein (TIGR00297 family)
LSPSGTVASAIVGAVAVAAGWDWALLLVIYFATSTALSKLGAERKARRTASVVAKSGARDAPQVLVNGGVFTAAAALALFFPQRIQLWHAIAAGALAASAADTWATEIGTWLGGTPRSAWNWRRVAPGTSGGMTTAGTIAMIGGAAVLAIAVYGLEWGHGHAIATLLGGLSGAVADTVIGATLQERRRCLGCGEHTERATHTCGSRTRVSRGIAGLGNDTVNLIATIVGSGIALWAAELLGA